MKFPLSLPIAKPRSNKVGDARSNISAFLTMNLEGKMDACGMGLIGLVFFGILPGECLEHHLDDVPLPILLEETPNFVGQ